MLASFALAAEEVARHSKIELAERPDVVLTTNGGYPLDRNLYQCVKGIAVPEEIVHKNSRIIMAGECSDGIAHSAFLDLMQSGTPGEIYRRIRSSDVPVCDQWQVQVLCRILDQNPVWFVTRSDLKSEVESAHMQYASTIEEALSSAKLTVGEKVVAIPEGPGVILKLAGH
jgi:nickel-dependent lactate racemase